MDTPHEKDTTSISFLCFASTDGTRPQGAAGNAKLLLDAAQSLFLISRTNDRQRIGRYARRHDLPHLLDDEVAALFDEYAIYRCLPHESLVVRVVNLLLVAVVAGTSACERYDPDVVAGGEVVTRACMVCHAQGINGAPIVGDKEMWKDRLQRSYEVMVERTTNGFGAMPARGGNPDLSDEQIGQAVKYMLAQLQETD